MHIEHSSNYSDAGFVKPRASGHKKRARNMKRQKTIIDSFCTSNYAPTFDKKRLENFKINYDLLNGRVDVKLYDTRKSHSFMGKTFKLDTNPVVHYPLISQVGQSMIGEHLRRPFSLAIKDLSPFKETFEQKEYNRLLKENITQTILNPLREKISGNLTQELGIENPLALTPEQQQEFQNELTSRVKVLTPKDIIDYMENDFRTPVAKQAQEVINYLSNTLDLKEKNLEGFIHMLPTGEEYYYVGEHRGELEFDNILPEEMIYGGSPTKTWVQDMDWAVRTRKMTLPHVTEKYAEYLTPSMLKDMEEHLSPIAYTDGSSNSYTHKQWANKLSTKLLMHDTSINQDEYRKKYGNLDTRTKEGHNNLMKINDNLGNKYGGDGKTIDNYGITVQHVVWKDDRMYKKVERYNEEEERTEFLWFSENYEPIEGDISVTKVWAKEVWEGTKIGEHYVKVQPVKYQYGSTKDPYKLELPYYGKKYFTYKNRSRNRSPIDSGKAYQRDFDIQMSELKHKLKTNPGKLFLYNLDMKPDKMTTKEFFSHMKEHGMITIQGKKHGSSPLDANQIKSIDASNMSEIVENINLLNFFREGLFDSMYFSRARAGAAGQYTNTTNLQSQQAASYNQTEPINETHRLIFEKACQALLNKARMHYQDHPEQIEHILSPVSLMELKAGKEFFYTEMGVVLENSGFEMQQIEFLKQQMTQFLGAAGGNGVDLVLEMSQANSKSDIINITRKYKKELAEAQESARQFEIQKEKESTERILAVEKGRSDERLAIHRETMENRIQTAEISAAVFERSADIDGNKKADILQAKETQIIFDREKLDKELEFKYVELDKTT